MTRSHATPQRIIIAVDDSERSKDAIAFGGALARAGGASVTVAHAYPWHHLRFSGTSEANAFLLEESERTLARMSEPLSDLANVELRSLADPSPARGLQALAAELEAGLIVVGSSHTGRLGRVLPGSTAERLLHGAACAVSVVPHGYATAQRHPSGVIACGWDGSPESEAALVAAEELARAMSTSLRVIRTFEPTAYAYPPALGVAYAHFTQDGRDEAKRALEERLAHIGAGATVEGELHEGMAAHELGDVCEAVDLMVLGSRGYGPLEAVLLGGVTGRVVRDAGCPVIVVPNGARRADRPLIAARAAAIAT